MKYIIPLGRCYYCICGWCSKRYDSQKCYYSAVNCYKCSLKDDKSLLVHTCDYFLDKTQNRIKHKKFVKTKKRKFKRDINFHRFLRY